VARVELSIGGDLLGRAFEAQVVFWMRPFQPFLQPVTKFFAVLSPNIEIAAFGWLYLLADYGLLLYGLFWRETCSIGGLLLQVGFYHIQAAEMSAAVATPT